MKKEKEYNFWQKLISQLVNVNVRYFYANQAEKAALSYYHLNDEQKKEFENTLKILEDQDEDENKR